MKDKRISAMVYTAVMAAALCILGPLSVPIGPVPVSLATFVIYIFLYVVGMKKGVAAVAVYLLLGLVGIPVFSGYSGGPAKMFGPTGGYLIGYLFLAAAAGYFIDRFDAKIIPSVLGMVIGTLILYVLGTTWLAKTAGMSFAAALSAGVIPFIGVDAAKMAAAAILGPVIRKAVKRALHNS